jgi:DNA-binding MarR family transcriptional regulator
MFATDRQLDDLLHAALADAPLKPDEFAVASVIAHEGPLRPTVLARLTGLRPTTLSNYLRRFEAEGLLTRTRDAEDGRAILVELTAEGRGRADACAPAFQQAQAAFESVLDELGAGQADILEALETISRALEVALENVRPAPRRA